MDHTQTQDSPLRRRPRQGAAIPSLTAALGLAALIGAAIVVGQVF